LKAVSRIDLIKWAGEDYPFVQEPFPAVAVIPDREENDGGAEMKTRAAAILIMVGILITAAIGCSSADAAANVPRNTHRNVEVSIDELMQNKQIAKTLEINEGDTLTLALGSNPTTGFSWTEQTLISDKTIIEQTNHESVAPATNALGAAGREVWTYRAMKAGTTEISTEYSRPWIGGEKAEWTFKLTLTVK
jgi:inhibitor of cysteine peptidase